MQLQGRWRLLVVPITPVLTTWIGVRSEESEGGGFVFRVLPTILFSRGLIKTIATLSGEGNGNPLQYSCLENPSSSAGFVLSGTPPPNNPGGGDGVGWASLLVLVFSAIKWAQQQLDRGCYGHAQRVFSSTTFQRHQFFGILPSLWSNSHICT